MSEVYCQMRMSAGKKVGKERRDERCPNRHGMHWGCCHYCERAAECIERCKNEPGKCGLLRVKGAKLYE